MKKGIFAVSMLFGVLLETSAMAEEQSTTQPRAIYVEKCGDLWCLVLELEKPLSQQFIMTKKDGVMVAIRSETDYRVKEVRLTIIGNLPDKETDIQKIVLQAWNEDLETYVKQLKNEEFGFLNERTTYEVFSVNSIDYSSILPEIKIKSAQIESLRFSKIMLLILVFLFLAVLFLASFKKESSFFRFLFSFGFYTFFALLVVSTNSILQDFFGGEAILVGIAFSFLLSLVSEFLLPKLFVLLLFGVAIDAIFYSAGWINGLLAAATAATAYLLGTYWSKRRIKKEQDRKFQKNKDLKGCLVKK